MKKTLIALAMMVSTASLAAADPIEGVWKTEVDDGAFAHIQISPCGANFCGTIARTFNASGEFQSENIGKMLVIDMAPAGGNKYNGKVWRPSNDKIYVGKVDLAGNSLKLSGCVAGGLICSKQTWSRVQ